VSRRTGSGKRKRHVTTTVYTKNKNEIIDFEGTCFTFTGPLEAGDYTIPFEFDLPQDIPASIMWSRVDIWANPRAKIQYTIEAEIENFDGSCLQY